MILHRNPIWIAFFSLIIIVTFFYTINAILDFYHYQRLNCSRPANEIKWSIKKVNDETFVPKGFYQFTYKGERISGYTSFQQHYLNPFAAKEAIDRLANANLQVWFDSSTPNFSTLEKNFPFKKIFYSLILWVLIFYLLWLDRRVILYKN
ncbi:MULTISPECIES: hypothetical protein [Candidatus Protochlamydia]|uniref:DUF3592 domain-containing protein n=1 Tax=Candidatus Protochlamydia amoebophila TaxID=362787 RepID=A0A0C1JV29_9BACT|nr:MULTISPECIES: hypothetical protein [Protochlamydia]KIC74261.1 hypothetical protein DB44_AM00190 [Candidatus Protochlamydia amoebophila]